MTRIERIKQDHGVLEVALRLGIELNRSLSGPCPRCGGTDRFYVQKARNTWACRGCRQRSGDVIDLVQHVLGLKFAAAVLWIEGRGEACKDSKDSKDSKDGKGCKDGKGGNRGPQIPSLASTTQSGWWGRVREGVNQSSEIDNRPAPNGQPFSVGPPYDPSSLHSLADCNSKPALPLRQAGVGRHPLPPPHPDKSGQGGGTRFPALSWSDPAWQRRILEVIERGERLLGEESAAQEYLLQRGLSPETWRAFRLGFTCYRRRDDGVLVRAIQMPWIGRDGRICAVRYRSIDPVLAGQPKIWSARGSEGLMFGGHLAQRRRWAVFCEGEFNAMSFWAAAEMGRKGCKGSKEVRGKAGYPKSTFGDPPTANPQPLSTIPPYDPYSLQSFPPDIWSFGGQTQWRRCLPALARLYERCLVWVDEPAVAWAIHRELRSARVRYLASPMVEGKRLDANDLLTGYGAELLGEMALDFAR